jgi:Xaa-Pro aminopeptidase
MKREGVESFLISNPVNVTYLTGFTGEDSFALISRKETVLLSDGRFTEQLALECPKLELLIRKPSEGLHQLVAEAVRKRKITSLGVDGTHLSISSFQHLNDLCTTTDVCVVPPLVEELRHIKDADELAQIKLAIEHAERGYAAMKSSLLPSQTEREAAFDLEHAMRRFGATRASFEVIVAAGDRSALPHARPTELRIDTGDFTLIDWGASAPSGYKSDLTRIIVTGKISAKLEKIYGVVLNAQTQGVQAIRPGITGREVDEVSRAVIEKAGFGKAFTHSLGHGIGMDIHEGPRVSPSSDQVLKPGMVVTVEPGIYLPGWGGIRIEDDVLVTTDGCEVLTSVPKDLDACRLRL